MINYEYKDANYESESDLKRSSLMNNFNSCSNQLSAAPKFKTMEHTTEQEEEETIQKELAGIYASYIYSQGIQELTTGTQIISNENGNSIIKTRHYQNAFNWFTEVINTAPTGAVGNSFIAKAKFAIASLYRDGKGIDQNNKAAFNWMLDSAIHGEIKAQYGIALMYKDGTGTLKSDKDAFKWFRTAVLNTNNIEFPAGHAASQYELAMMYKYGKGTTPNPYYAFTWFKKAAKQGNTYAQYELALMYKDGIGVAQSDGMAFYWYEKTADREPEGHPLGQHLLASMYKDGKGVTQSDEKAFKYFNKAAAPKGQYKGYPASYHELGKMYLEGRSVKQSNERAFTCFCNAITLGGHQDAKEQLKLMLQNTLDQKFLNITLTFLNKLVANPDINPPIKSYWQSLITIVTHKSATNNRQQSADAIIFSSNQKAAEREVLKDSPSRIVNKQRGTKAYKQTANNNRQVPLSMSII